MSRNVPRIALALLAGGAIFAAVFGSAASMGPVTPEQMAAGDAPVEACQPEDMPVIVDFEMETVDIGTAEQPDWTPSATAALVSGIADRCRGQTLNVQAAGDLRPVTWNHGWQGPPLGPPCKVIVTGPSVRCPFPQPAELEDIFGVYVQIHGRPAPQPQ